MAERYQSRAKKFEVMGRKEVVVRFALPLVEVWEELQPEVENLTGLAGLQIIRAVIEDEVMRRGGPRHRPDPVSSCLRRGQQSSNVVFAGQKVGVERLRVRSRKGEEVMLDNYARLQHDGRRQRAVRESIVAGLTTRNYHRAMDSVLEGYGIEKSSVNRQFVQGSAAQLKKLCEKKLVDLGLVAILIDGIQLSQQVLVVALGVESGGKKHVLGLWQGATENTTVVKELLQDLVTRGLNSERRYLFVIDGAKALRAAIERVFGQRAEVQLCQIHKRRNVKEHLPKNAQGDTDRRIRKAYAMTDYAAAKVELGKINRQLERINPSAACSLFEGILWILRSGACWQDLPEKYPHSSMCWRLGGAGRFAEHVARVSQRSPLIELSHCAWYKNSVWSNRSPTISGRKAYTLFVHKVCACARGHPRRDEVSSLFAKKPFPRICVL